ncbi:MAG: TolC family protein, partial [Bacteroidetes bacterium]|nr:TolC family protein [Bacteroidota bacterium]
MGKHAWRMVLWAAIFMLIVMINACKIAQPYHQPNDAISNKLYRDSSKNDPANNIATISWKEMFTDTLLQSLIQEGINNNFDLKIAAARIKTAAANFKQSKLALLPGIDANPSASFQRVSSTQFGFPETYAIGISTSWEADVWGKLSSAKRAALASLLQSESYKKAVQTQLVADIVINYYSLLAYEAQLHITERTVENRAKEVETMKALKESNVVTGAAVVQSEANRYSVEITIPDLKQNIRETENMLSLLLGKPPDTIYRATLEQQMVTTNLATGVPAQLLANRPDVQEAENQLRNSFELVNVARTYFYPSFTITGATGFSATSLSQLFNPANFFAYLTGSLLQPVFEQGRNKQRLAVAQANQEEYLNAFKKTLLVAGKEVSDALYSYKASLEKQSLRKQQIAYLQKSVDYTKQLLEYSSATNYTDV